MNYKKYYIKVENNQYGYLNFDNGYGVFLDSNTEIMGCQTKFTYDEIISNDLLRPFIDKIVEVEG